MRNLIACLPAKQLALGADGKVLNLDLLYVQFIQPRRSGLPGGSIHLHIGFRMGTTGVIHRDYPPIIDRPFIGTHPEHGAHTARHFQ